MLCLRAPPLHHIRYICMQLRLSLLNCNRHANDALATPALPLKTPSSCASCCSAPFGTLAISIDRFCSAVIVALPKQCACPGLLSPRLVLHCLHLYIMLALPTISGPPGASLAAEHVRGEALRVRAATAAAASAVAAVYARQALTRLLVTCPTGGGTAASGGFSIDSFGTPDRFLQVCLCVCTLVNVSICLLGCPGLCVHSLGCQACVYIHECQACVYTHGRQACVFTDARLGSEQCNPRSYSEYCCCHHQSCAGFTMWTCVLLSTGALVHACGKQAPACQQRSADSTCNAALITHFE